MKVDVMDGAIRQIEKIKADRLHGASYLSRQALEVLKLVIEKFSGPKGDFLGELECVADRLTKARPGMASIANIVARLVYEAFRVSKGKDVDFLKDFAYSKIKELKRASELSLEKAAAQGAQIIEDNDRIITCSYSSTIKEVFRIAYRGKKNVRVWVLESNYQDKSYGRMMADELHRERIFTSIIPESAIKTRITEASKVLVGADSVLRDGGLVNGLPTHELALAAKSRLPFYVVCESLKFNPRVSSKQVKLEEGFDLTPLQLITGIITEKGMFHRENLTPCMKKLGRYFEVF